MDPVNRERFDALEGAADYLHLYATVLSRQFDRVEAASVLRQLTEFGEDPHVQLAAVLSDMEALESLERDLLLLTLRDLGKELLDVRKVDAAEAVNMISAEAENYFGPPEDREGPKH